MLALSTYGNIDDSGMIYYPPRVALALRTQDWSFRTVQGGSGGPPLALRTQDWSFRTVQGGSGGPPFRPRFLKNI